MSEQERKLNLRPSSKRRNALKAVTTIQMTTKKRSTMKKAKMTRRTGSWMMRLSTTSQESFRRLC